jgi:hypothetical protein
MGSSIISHHGYKLLAGETKGSELVTAAVAVGRKTCCLFDDYVLTAAVIVASII